MDAEVPTTAAEGTTGEPQGDLGAAVGSPSAGLDEQTIKTLESIEPDAIPKALRAKLEQKLGSDLQADYTRKTQALADRERMLTDRERQLLDSVVSKLGERGIQPTQDERAQLLDRIRGGEWDVIGTYVDKTVQQSVAPFAQQVAMNQAIQTAQSLHPYVKEKEAEIAAILRNDPALGEAVRENNFARAPLILQGIALHLEAQDLKAKLAQSEAVKEAYAQQKVKEEIAKLRAGAAATQTTTSRAGTSPRATTAPGPMTLEKAFATALREQNISPDPWFER